MKKTTPFGSVFTRSNGWLLLLTLALLLLLLLSALGCASTQPKRSVRAVEEKRYIRIEHLSDNHQCAATNSAHVVPMSCANCKLVWVSVNSSWPNLYGLPDYGSYGYGRGSLGFRFPQWERRHFCPGCKSVITTTREGKQRSVNIDHSCTSCGDASMLCCTTTPDGRPTSSMNNAPEKSETTTN